MFPYNNDLKKMAEQMNPADVHSYVQDMIKRLTPSASATNQTPFMGGEKQNQEPSPALQADVFETFDNVFVRIVLPPEVTLSHIRIFHTSNQAIVENTLEKGNRTIITLPCLVKKKGATAQVKDDILEIKFPKSSDLQFTEISISEKL